VTLLDAIHLFETAGIKDPVRPAAARRRPLAGEERQSRLPEESRQSCFTSEARQSRLPETVRQRRFAEEARQTCLTAGDWQKNLIAWDKRGVTAAKEAVRSEIAGGYAGAGEKTVVSSDWPGPRQVFRFAYGGGRARTPLNPPRSQPSEAERDSRASVRFADISLPPNIRRARGEASRPLAGEGVRIPREAFNFASRPLFAAARETGAPPLPRRDAVAAGGTARRGGFLPEGDAGRVPFPVPLYGGEPFMDAGETAFPGVLRRREESVSHGGGAAFLSSSGESAARPPGAEPLFAPGTIDFDEILYHIERRLGEAIACSAEGV
jgi:hypothetical protein